MFVTREGLSGSDPVYCCSETLQIPQQLLVVRYCTRQLLGVKKSSKTYTCMVLPRPMV